MRKKIILFSVIIISVIIALITLNSKDIKRYYVILTTDLSAGTGAITATPNPSGLKKADSINSLQKSLPLSRPTFTISSYDYSKGKFIVDLKQKIASEAVDFSNWYQTSSYSAIPLNMFYLK